MIKYVDEKAIIYFNNFIIRKTSPHEIIGVKEPASLDMAVNSPQQEVFGRELYPTIELKAANLYRNLVMKHIFHNANKRTALMSLRYFFRINDIPFTVTEQEAEDFTVKIAVDRLEEEEIAEWIKNHM